MLKVAIIGGGAAGCFAAVNIKEQNPDIDVTVYEAGAKLLAKLLAKVAAAATLPIPSHRCAAWNPSIRAAIA